MEYTESIYGGQDSALNPSFYSPLFPNTYFSELGTSQDARTANQIRETSKHLNTGLRTFEVAAHSPEVLDAIPRDHMKEIHRMAKLTGSEATMHAPMIDPTGITERGWDEINMAAAERQLWQAVERSHDLDPNGNINVTMHASTVGLPFPELKVKEGEEEKTKSLILIDSQGKNLTQIRETEKYFPEEGGEVKQQVFDPVKETQRINKEAWNEQLHNIAYYLDIGQDRMGGGEGVIEAVTQLPGAEESGQPEYQETQKKLQRGLEHGEIYLKQTYKRLKDLFDLAWKNSDEKDRVELRKFADRVSPYVKDIDNVGQNKQQLHGFAEALEFGVKTFKGISNPEIYVPLREYATEKSAETVSNLALRSYKKFKDTAPIIAVENHPAGQSLLTTGEDLKNVIEKAQDLFIEKAKKEGISSGEAKRQAKKLIGATWDVGHINMLRKYGYTEEDIIEETKKVAPYVKKVHLSDNFGFEHTELPMGMGNVPIKEIMSQLGKKGFKGKKIVEALSWWQHFSEQERHHAIVPTLQGFNSPIYGMANAPYWNQAIGGSGAYQGFPMAYMPEKHFSMYGSSFVSLPEELGGQIPGTQSRFSGTANA